MSNEKKSIHHSFDIDLAALYGVHEAILIHHFQHWIRVNQRLKRNFHEGRTWTYQTLDEIAAHFPYLSRSEIFELIERLCTGKGRRSKKEKEFEPILRKGNFNKKKFDKTTWYAFEDSNYFYDIGLSQNGDRLEPIPIPDTKPDTKPSSSPTPSSKVGKKEEEDFPPEIRKELDQRFLESPLSTIPNLSKARKKAWEKTVFKNDIEPLLKLKAEESEAIQLKCAAACKDFLIKPGKFKDFIADLRLLPGIIEVVGKNGQTTKIYGNDKYFEQDFQYLYVDNS